VLHQLGSRVVYVGGISRFEGRTAASATKTGVLFLGGGGGGMGDPALTTSLLNTAAASSPETTWAALGVESSAMFHGEPWVEDPWPYLSTAEIVVSWAGQNSIADLAASGARAIVIPQERPFGEQVATGLSLQRTGLATVVPAWPTASDWPGLLRLARTSTPRWTQWQIDGAARRAADAIAEVARAGGRAGAGMMGGIGGIGGIGGMA